MERKVMERVVYILTPQEVLQAIDYWLRDQKENVLVDRNTGSVTLDADGGATAVACEYEQEMLVEPLPSEAS